MQLAEIAIVRTRTGSRNAQRILAIEKRIAEARTWAAPGPCIVRQATEHERQRYGISLSRKGE